MDTWLRQSPGPQATTVNPSRDARWAAGMGACGRAVGPDSFLYTLFYMVSPPLAASLGSQPTQTTATPTWPRGRRTHYTQGTLTPPHRID